MLSNAIFKAFQDSWVSSVILRGPWGYWRHSGGSSYSAFLRLCIAVLRLCKAVLRLYLKVLVGPSEGPYMLHLVECCWDFGSCLELPLLIAAVLRQSVTAACIGTCYHYSFVYKLLCILYTWLFVDKWVMITWTYASIWDGTKAKTQDMGKGNSKRGLKILQDNAHTDSEIGPTWILRFSLSIVLAQPQKCRTWTTPRVSPTALSTSKHHRRSSKAVWRALKTGLESRRHRIP